MTGIYIKHIIYKTYKVKALTEKKYEQANPYREFPGGERGREVRSEYISRAARRTVERITSLLEREVSPYLIRMLPVACTRYSAKE